MKWFKHMSHAFDDQRLQLYMAEFGRNHLEAYGFYWRLLEVVAEQIDETDACEVEYPLQFWARKFGITRKKFTQFVQVLHKVCALSAQVVQNNCKISIPKLLEIRDNHTKNLQVTYKQEEEEEEDIPIVPKSDQKKQFSEFWQAYPKKCGKVKSEEKYKRLLKSGTPHGEIMEGLKRYLQTKNVKDGYVKNPLTWLNGQHWQDEYMAEPHTKPPGGITPFGVVG